ncbi:Rare lipoprotein A (RlpA)-like double-psi beta-barrel [Siphonobacter aquaeclarae]|uniref:Probable endolytic peptidoglycan transglycosylase RlpA n=2 Tax=Siphonobacter aquaeclarae TaxID=563176 RepID=A0A1G9PCW2_9BACT|nr:Rare lipoprotein A (RlpA)-like double-psi beta-barrel [Siphonobacter aquaeclarae]
MIRTDESLGISRNSPTFAPLTESLDRMKVLQISALLSCFAFGKVKAQTVAEVKGLASFYHSKFEGKKTAAGERFDQDFLTAAHRTWPFNTLVEVTSTDTKKSIIVRINDRGPFSRHRLIDMSETGARLLGVIGKGVAQVRLRILRWGGAAPILPGLEPAVSFSLADSLVRRPMTLHKARH